MFALSYVLRQIHGYLITGPESRGDALQPRSFPEGLYPFARVRAMWESMGAVER